MFKEVEKTQGLAKLFLMAESEGEMAGLIHDLFTTSEIARAHERAKIFACLKNGLSQRETKRKTNAAIATVTHGAKFLHDSAMVVGKIIAQAQKMIWWQKLFWRA